MAAINNDWLDALKEEFSKPYYRELFKKVNEEYSRYQIFPPADDIFNAFHLTPLSKVKVVILGQVQVSQCRTGTWTLLFGKERCRYSAVTGQYL